MQSNPIDGTGPPILEPRLGKGNRCPLQYELSNLFNS
jgi:hypothetical protein